jgi:hypothetical protein
MNLNDERSATRERSDDEIAFQIRARLDVHHCKMASTLPQYARPEREEDDRQSHYQIKT